MNAGGGGGGLVEGGEEGSVEDRSEIREGIWGSDEILRRY